MIYGYARVSTDGQSVEAQVRQLTKAGCKKVFREVAERVWGQKFLSSFYSDPELRELRTTTVFLAGSGRKTGTL